MYAFRETFSQQGLHDHFFVLVDDVEKVDKIRSAKHKVFDTPLVELLARYELYRGEPHDSEPNTPTTSQLINAFGTADRDECIRHILLHGEKVHMKHGRK